MIYNVANMRKVRYFLTILPISISFLSGCSTNKPTLTYGTYIGQTIYTQEEINSFELFMLAEALNQTFILAVYQGEYSQDCLCWSTFQNVIANYSNKYHEQVFIFNGQNQDEATKDMGITKMDSSTPSLYIFQGKRKIASFFDSKKQDHAIFEDLSGETMYQRIHQKVNAPHLFYVDEKYLDDNLSKQKESLLLFARFSCNDCLYSLQNVILPYVEKNNGVKDIMLYDLENEYSLAINPNATNEEKERYQAIKDKYNLSKNGGSLFGYNNGVVPTIQYYESGVLKSASVFFNDVINQKEDGSYYISDSFYSEDRLTSLEYLKGLDNTVLKGKILSENEVIKTSTNYMYWSQEKAAQYHKPLLEAFLDFYCK